MSPLPPGPELDRLVAEKVMGWEPARGVGSHWVDSDSQETPYVVGGRDTGFHPSTNIAHAIEVVNHFSRLKRGPTMYVPHSQTDEGLSTGDLFTCVIPGTRNEYGERNGDMGYAKADTLPHAICLAALTAVEAE